MAGRAPWLARLARWWASPPAVRWTGGGHPECGRCGLRFTTLGAFYMHRARDGSCLDPVTARRPRGGLLLSRVWTDDDGTPLWGWPRGVLDARDLDDSP